MSVYDNSFFAMIDSALDYAKKHNDLKKIEDLLKIKSDFKNQQKKEIELAEKKQKEKLKKQAIFLQKKYNPNLKK